ncbi:MAG: ABC transporter ATP-binding protein [Anaerolineales bacterium]|nr:ABC transporter ATP-binding protein [Anaerolineales bacterium]
MTLEVNNIHKSFEDTIALKDVSFTLQQGKTIAILGPSGCGKSTLLSIIAGLQSPDRGSVIWEDTDQSEIPVHKRGFGLMFQDYALFPHKNVFDNIAFGLKMKNQSAEEIQKRVDEVLDMVGLGKFSSRRIFNLSGGEQQRVALARAIAPEPGLLLLDEPLGALDRNLREQLLSDLQHLISATHQTTIYVTHDQEEAFTLADQVLILNHGKVIQEGNPFDIFQYPDTPFIARFLGQENIFDGEIHDNVLYSPLGQFPVNSPVTGKVTFLVRPNAVTLGNGKDCRLSGVIRERLFQGVNSKIIIEVNGKPLNFFIPSNQVLPPVGAPVCLDFSTNNAFQIWKQND